MITSANWLKKIPRWVWFSFIPIFGGLAISYAGYKVKIKNWVWLGLSLTVSALVLPSTHIAYLIWLTQIATAFHLKKRYLIKIAPKGLNIPDVETAQLMAEMRGKIDINNCSKHDLVYELGLPIIYANNIEVARHDGHIFTHLEELRDIAGIPENYLNKIEPLIIFSYDINQESAFSWRRLNTFSLPELVALGIDEEIAKTILAEREKNGMYNSLIDVKRRTGISLNNYHF